MLNKLLLQHAKINLILEKQREHEKLMSLTSSINDVSVQDNQHSVTELSNKNNLSCSKVFVQEQIKQLNEMRTHFIQISKEKEQFNNQLQLMQENNRTLKNNKQEFWPFLKEYGAIMFLAIFFELYPQHDWYQAEVKSTSIENSTK